MNSPRDGFLSADNFLDDASDANGGVAPQKPFLSADSFLDDIGQPEPSRLGIIDTAKAIGGQLSDAVAYHLPGASASALEGSTPYAETDWKDDLINRSRRRAQEVSAEHDGQSKTALPGVSYQDINSLGPSLAFSGVGMGAGLIGGLAGTIAGNLAAPVVGTVAGYGAGMAASGAAAYSMSTNQFMRDLRDAADQDAMRSKGRLLTDDEFTQQAAALEPLVKEYGLWEAAPEAIGNAVGFGLLKAPIKGAIGSIFGENVLRRISSKAVGLYGSELATETVTQQGQNNVQVDAGLGGERRDWLNLRDIGQSLADVAPSTILQTTLLAGAAGGAMKLHEKLSAGRSHDLLGDNGTQDNGPPASSGETYDPRPEPARTTDGEVQQAAQAMDEAQSPANQPPLKSADNFLDGNMEEIPSSLPSEDKASPISDGLEKAREAWSRYNGSMPLSDDELRTLDDLSRKTGRDIADVADDWAEARAQMFENSGLPDSQPQFASDYTGIGLPPRGYIWDIPFDTEHYPTLSQENDAPVSSPQVSEGPHPSQDEDAPSAPPVGDGSRLSPVQVTADASHVGIAAEKAHPEPTQAQKEAGNYAKGHIKIHGLDVSIENAKGGTRSGSSPTGEPWSVAMPAHYGYVKRTTGADGDQVDVYIGDTPGSDKVFVVDQISPETGKFDEHKVILGTSDSAEAISLYDSGFSDGRGASRRGAVTAMSVEEFKDWLRNGNTKNAIAYKPQKIKRTAPTRQDQKQDVQPEIFGQATETSGPEVSQQPSAPLFLESFSDKAIIVRGDTKTHKDAIKAAGGKWHRKGNGWIFPKAKEKDVREKLANLLSVSPAATPSTQSGAGSDGVVEVPSSKEHPGLIVNSLQTGKTRTIQPYGTVPIIDDRKEAIKRRAREIGKQAYNDGDSRLVPPSMKGLENEWLAGYGEGIAEYTQENGSASSSDGYGKDNKIFTKDSAEKAREVLRKKLNGNQLNSGIDPEIIQAGITLAGYHIEAGARSFSAYSKAMITDLGEVARPYLRSWYEGVRYFPGFDASGMSSIDDIEALDQQDTSPQETKTPAKSPSDPSRGSPNESMKWVKDHIEVVHVTGDKKKKEESKPSSGSQKEQQPEVSDHDHSTPDRSSKGIHRNGDEGHNSIDMEGAKGKRGPRSRLNREGGGSDSDVQEPVRRGHRERDNDSPESEAGGLRRTEGDPAPGASKVAVVEDSVRPSSGVHAGPGERGRERGLVGRGRGERGGLPVLNYSAPEGSLSRAGSWKETASRNLDIIEIIHALDKDGRSPSREEQELISKYVGWGSSEMANGLFGAAVKKVDGYEFALWKAKYDWKDIVDRASKVLSPEEIESAARSTQYAHYTSEGMIRGIWSAVDRMGFKGGKILEPGMGIGLFPVAAPKGVMERSSYTGIEMDKLTASIAHHLLPQANVLHADFVKQKLPDGFFDIAIGNPPFSQTRITDDPAYKRQRFMLHDYFFAKSIDKVRPGGLLVFVTSKGTMDKGDAKARQYIADRADLLGAIRLPQTAFKQNAGTEVVTDVLFFRKRLPDEVKGGEAWADRKEVSTAEGGKTLVNEYFANHPEMVLGRHSLSGSMRHGNEYTVLPLPGDIENLFADAAKNLPKEIYRNDAPQQVRDSAIERDFDPKAKKEGAIYRSDDGNLMRLENGVGVPLGSLEKLSARDSEWLGDYIGLRDAIKRAQLDQLTDEAWEDSLSALNKTYGDFVKKHGQISEFTTYTRKDIDEDGNERVREYRRFKNSRLLEMDVEGALTSVLEQITEDGTIVKASFLKSRALKKPARAEIHSTQDALMVSLDERGELDLKHVAKLIGKAEGEVINDLGNSIYHAPGDRWQLSDEYLSGDVVTKLEEASAAASVDSSYQRNVKALLDVQPRPLAPTEISVSLGASWVPEKVIRDFASDVLKKESAIQYNPITGAWDVDGASSRSSRSSHDEWGTSDRSSLEILFAVLNSRELKVTKTIDDGISKKTMTDDAATVLVNEKAKQMRDKFKSWVWTDARRTEELSALYNRKFNNIAPRRFNGEHLTLPGLSIKYTLHPHQKRAIWRIIQTGNTYLAHSVGAGKTLEMIVSAMEQKRLGLIKKPLFIVPNHMLDQFSQEFMDAYPAAHIMVASEKNFHTSNRRRFVAQAALNNPDAVIMTHSAFKLIGVSEDSRKAVVDDMQSELLAALSELKKGDDRITRKKMEQQVEALARRFTGKTNSDKQDNVISFEELGVDMLYVDEAHVFRKLDFTTNRGNVKGIDPSGSVAALDLFIKTRWLDSQNPGRSLVMASGTPITNTMAEIYTAMRYLDSRSLELDGLKSFDAWASQFGEEVVSYEPNAAGRYEPVTRFARFVNVPELMKRVRSFMDVLTSSQLGALVERPNIRGGAPQSIITEATRDISEYMEGELSQRILESRAWKPSPSQPGNPDPLVAIITDGRLSAIDMRFVDPKAKNNPDSKLNKMISKIIETHNATADIEFLDKDSEKVDPLKGGAQIVFSAVGFGEGAMKNRGFDLRAHVMQRFKDAGISAAEVAWMSDFDTHAKKEAMYKDMRNGKKRILIGSPQNMGTGLNVQKRLVALHYLSPPWYPADIEQPHGRILRQGNQNKDVDIFWYATKGTYDSTAWSMVSRKARFIEQAFTGDDSVRVIDDVSEASQYEMASALAAGDDRAIKLAGLQADIERLNRLEEAHHRQQQNLRWEKPRLERTISKLKETGEALAKAKDAAPFISVPRITIDGKTAEKHGAVGDAVIERASKAFQKWTPKNRDDEKTITIGELDGCHPVTLALYADGDGKAFDLSVVVGELERKVYEYAKSFDDVKNVGLATRLQNTVNNISHDINVNASSIRQAEADLRGVVQKMGVPFEQFSELSDKAAEAASLREELHKSGQQEEPPPSPDAILPSFQRGEAAEHDDSSGAMERDIVRGLSAVPSQKFTKSQRRLIQDVNSIARRLMPSAQVQVYDKMRATEETGQPGSVFGAQWRRLNGTEVSYIVAWSLEPDSYTKEGYDDSKRATIRHEAIHYLTQSSLLDAVEYSYLRESALRQGWIDRHKIRSRYIGAGKDALVEEAIAEEFASWRQERWQGIPLTLRRIFMRIDLALKRIAALTRRVFGKQATIEDIFADIESGSVGRRKESSAPSAEGPRFTRGHNSQSDVEQAASHASESLRRNDRRTSPAGRSIRGFAPDMSRIVRWFIHPRMIAAMDGDFTHVYRTAVQQFENRDAIAANLGRKIQPYFDLPAENKKRVNAVLELHRLQKETPSEGEDHSVINTYGNTELSKLGDKIELNEAEIKGYRAVRDAMDAALSIFQESVIEELGLDPQKVKGPDDVVQLIKNAGTASEKRFYENAYNIISQINDSRMSGYVPFTRWGDVGISVTKPVEKVDQVTGEVITGNTTLHFEKVEVPALTGNALATKLRLAHTNMYDIPAVKARLKAVEDKFAGVPGAKIDVFQVNGHIPSGESLSIPELMGLLNDAGIDEETKDRVIESVMTQIQSKTFRKHFFSAKDTPGYSVDFERAIADYIVGMSGYISRRKHKKLFDKAIGAIPFKKPKLLAYAKNYRDYVNSPIEEFQMIRQVGFVYYLAGAIDSALVNLSQVPLFTAPYLKMFAGHRVVARELKRAYKDTASMLSVEKSRGFFSASSKSPDFFDPDKAPADVREALKAAWDEGFFVPQNTYEMIGMAHTRNPVSRGAKERVRNIVDRVSTSFTVAERTNRIATFVAAYRIGAMAGTGQKALEVLKKNPLANTEDLLVGYTPKKFAEWVIDETHFKLGKVNRPTLMRGFGAWALQFKGFVMQSIELMVRCLAMYGREGRVSAGLMLMMLWMTAGLWGQPFSEDIVTAAEAAWKNLASEDVDIKTEVREAIATLTSSPLVAEIITEGPMRLSGIDLSGRTGMGHIVPTSVDEAGGVPLSLTVGRADDFIEQAKRGEWLSASGTLVPRALQNIITAHQWSETGVRSKGRDKPIIAPEKVTGADVALKAIGFTSAHIANQRESERAQTRASYAVSELRELYLTKMGKAQAAAVRAARSGDIEGRKKANLQFKEILKDLAERNSGRAVEDLIIISNESIMNRTRRELEGADAVDRAAPKNTRGRRQQIQEAYGSE